MKFKLAQLATLLTFVMAILMLSLLDEVKAGDPSAHMPDLWINGDSTSDNYGKLETPDNPGLHLIGQAEDPRGKSFNEMCGTNGDESVSGFAWYYKGGMMDNPSAHAADPNASNHATEHVQTIYTLYLNGSASTSAKEASGSLDPGIEHAESIELPAAHNTRSFKGQGKITLNIKKTDYHVPNLSSGDKSMHYSGCITHTSDEYYFRPPSESAIKVLVNIENVKEKRTGAINVGGQFKGAGGQFTHSWEWEKSWFKTKGRGFGMRASAGGWWKAYWNPEIKLQEKSAEVNGWVQKAGLPTLKAEFDKRNSWCPPDTYSTTPPEYIPHLLP